MKRLQLNPSEITKTTSWSIFHGSLDDTVTYESSLSAVDSDSVAVIRREPPLVLRRPSSESPPCEITNDSIRPGTRVEGLAGNSLMLVLVPPLLQLSKTRIS
ncbi:hypothetical protein Ancab_006596 [Ancistrocladus abbreviatus]